MLIVSLCLRHRTAWVRVSMRVISVLSMFSFPGGTLTGILQFVFFGKPGARLPYSARALQPLSEVERAELVERHESASDRAAILTSTNSNPGHFGSARLVRIRSGVIRC
jgi:hypothetical protein